jgi:mRNA interferase MazF
MATTRTGKSIPINYPKRGEIYLTALDPTVGHEIRKTRPALVIQNDTSNRYSATTVVAPITSKVRLPLSPVHVLLQAKTSTGLDVPSVAVFTQVRAVDRRRLLRRLCQADALTMAEVDQAIQIALGVITSPLLSPP